MEIVRTVRVREYECYRLEINEDLARSCEANLKVAVVDPDTVPHISPQTLMQCWEDEGSHKLQNYVIEINGYLNSHKEYLVEWVRSWLSDVLWEQEPSYGDSEVIDYEDEAEWWDDEHRLIFEDANPDFVDDEEDQVSPEGKND